MTREDIIRLALMGERTMKQRIEWAVDMEREACAMEREACAKIADGWPDYNVQGLAEAIRARGQV